MTEPGTVPGDREDAGRKDSVMDDDDGNFAGDEFRKEGPVFVSRGPIKACQ